MWHSDDLLLRCCWVCSFSGISLSLNRLSTNGKAKASATGVDVRTSLQKPSLREDAPTNVQKIPSICLSGTSAKAVTGAKLLLQGHDAVSPLPESKE